MKSAPSVCAQVITVLYQALDSWVWKERFGQRLAYIIHRMKWMHLWIWWARLLHRLSSRVASRPVDKKSYHRLPIWATPSTRSNPTAERTDGNACVVCSQDNVEKFKSLV